MRGPLSALAGQMSIRLPVLILSSAMLASHASADESKGNCTVTAPAETTCSVTNQHLLRGGNNNVVVAVITMVRMVLVEKYWENKTKSIFNYGLSKVAHDFDAHLNIDFLDNKGDTIVPNAIVIPIDRSCPRPEIGTADQPARQGIIDYDYAPAVKSIRFHDDGVILFEGPC